AVRHSTVELPFIGGTNAVVRSIVYVHVPAAVIVAWLEFRRDLYPSVPSHVSGSGVSTKPTSTGTTSRPQISWIVAGAPGSVAAVRHSTVELPLDGGTRIPILLTLIVCSQASVFPVASSTVHVRVTIIGQTPVMTSI